MGEKNFSLSQIYLRDNNGNISEIECNSVEFELSREEKEVEEFNPSFKGISVTFKLDKKYELELMKMIYKYDPFISEKFKRKYKYLKRCYNRDLLYKKRR